MEISMAQQKEQETFPFGYLKIAIMWCCGLMKQHVFSVNTSSSLLMLT